LTKQLGEEVAGWKVGPERDGIVLRGAIYRSRVFQSPATIIASTTPLLGVEAEIAFCFDRPLESRSSGYSHDGIASAVTAFASIEIVDTRFQSYHEAPFLDRAADLMSNGAFVIGTIRDDWHDFDLASLEIVLPVAGREIVHRAGGHASGDPILPAIELVNDMTKEAAIPAGTFMATGTYTGLNFAKPGDLVKADFVGFGEAEIMFEV
jgi:2-keto-4-pentenoate hydratase